MVKILLFWTIFTEEVSPPLFIDSLSLTTLLRKNMKTSSQQKIVHFDYFHCTPSTIVHISVLVVQIVQIVQSGRPGRDCNQIPANISLKSLKPEIFFVEPGRMLLYHRDFYHRATSHFEKWTDTIKIFREAVE